MYYPIIDKLKDVMEEIGQGGGGGQLVIEGTVTSQTGGTWEGSFSDIESAFTNNTPIYCAVSAEGKTLMFALVSFLVPYHSAICAPIPHAGGGNFLVLTLNSDNTFTIDSE